MVTSMLEQYVFEMPMGWCATGGWWSSSRLELVQYPRPQILIVAVIGLDSWDSTNMEFAIQRGMEVNFDALLDPQTRLQQLKETFINMGVSIHHLHSSNRLVKFEHYPACYFLELCVLSEELCVLLEWKL